MKTNVVVSLVLFASLMSTASVKADVISVSSGEIVMFNDTFADNSNGWSNIAVLNGTGTATSGKAAIGSGEWTPSIPDNHTGVTSVTTNFSALDLSAGAISLYMNVNVEDYYKNPAHSRYGIKLYNSGAGGGSFDFEIMPNNGTITNQEPYIQYTAAAGGSQTDYFGSTTSIIKNGLDYYSFKMTITAAETAGQANIQTYYYDDDNSSYVAWGTNSVLAGTGTGLTTDLFNTLTIYNRNGNAISGGSDAAKFSQVTVTQVPEPGSIAMMLIGGLAMGMFFIRRKK